MPFQRSCLYHRTLPMRVIEEDKEAEYKRLLDTGEWFDHPNKPFEVKEEPDYEEPIRRSTRKGRKHCEQQTKETGI